MESGIQTYKDFFELLSYVVTTLGAIALIYGVFAYNISKKQLNFSVLNRCIDVFQKDYSNLSEKSEPERLKAYIDFVNEELFYFQQNYIPKEVALEWIDGMIDIMPIYGPKGSLANNMIPVAVRIHELNFLNSFQRVKEAFRFKTECKFDLIYADYESGQKYEARRDARKKLAEEIYENLN